MSRCRWNISPLTVRRTLNSVQAAGLVVERIEFEPDGRLIITPARPIEHRPVDVVERQHIASQVGGG
jgi:hypothetical protein